MGEIVVLKPANAVEFDGPALSLVARLADAALRASALTEEAESIQVGTLAKKTSDILESIISMMRPIQVAIDTLLENSSVLREEASGAPIHYSINGGEGVMVVGRVVVLCSTIRVQTISFGPFGSRDPLRIAPPGSLILRRLRAG